MACTCIAAYDDQTACLLVWEPDVLEPTCMRVSLLKCACSRANSETRCLSAFCSVNIDAWCLKTLL